MLIARVALGLLVGFVPNVETKADSIQTEFLPSGATAKVGGYRPNRAEMTEEMGPIAKVPEGLEAPKFGTITLGEQKWSFLLDEPAEGPAKLFVDTNGDGDLTNDPETKWESSDRGGLKMYQGSATVDLGQGRIGSLGMYRFDPKDEQRAALKNTVLFYTDFGYQLKLQLDGQDFESFVAGEPSSDTSLWLDRDGNGRRSSKRESVFVDRPFNFTGTTYVLKYDQKGLALEKAPMALEQTPMPPDLRVGKETVPFQAKTMDGTEVDFPKSYSGKVVLLDFWATWCGPCIAELPNVKQAYGDWHEQGFEVLGVSLDDVDMEEKLKEFAKENEVPWPQIYEGKGWDISLGEIYDVSGIPFVLLIDGDSGEILATERELRGPKLTEFIGQVIEKRKK